MTIYKFKKKNYTHNEWDTLLNDHPNPMIDNESVVGFEVGHDGLRICQFRTLLKFFIDHDFNDFLMGDILKNVIHWNEKQPWEFKGDGGELGFILDIWSKDYSDVIESYQYWFMDYE